MAKTPRGSRTTTPNAQSRANSAKTKSAAAKVAVQPEVIDDSVAEVASEVAQEKAPATPPADPIDPTALESAFQPHTIDRVAAAAARREAAARRTNMLESQISKVEAASDNPGLDKFLGKPTNLPEKQVNRPAIYDMVDRTLQPFVEEMSPNAAVSDARAGELHYSVSTLIKYLLNVGGNEMKVGVPYLLSYYRKYKNSVFHPQNHHRGVGAMRGSDADIDFYRNMSRLLVDISHPDDAELVLRRTDISRFRKLTMSITSPAAQRMSENLVALVSRVHAR